MHFFGFWGSVISFLGFCIWVYMAIGKLFIHNFTIVDRPIFFVGLISIVVGVQLFLAGFLGELITRNAPERNFYLIEKKEGW